MRLRDCVDDRGDDNDPNGGENIVGNGELEGCWSRLGVCEGESRDCMRLGICDELFGAVNGRLLGSGDDHWGQCKLR